MIRWSTGIFHSFLNVDTAMRWFLTSILLFLKLFWRKKPADALLDCKSSTEKVMKITSEQVVDICLANALFRALCPTWKPRSASSDAMDDNFKIFWKKNRTFNQLKIMSKRVERKEKQYTNKSKIKQFSILSPSAQIPHFGGSTHVDKTRIKVKDPYWIRRSFTMLILD